MPFQSASQMRLCYARLADDLCHGRAPQWDCESWYHETPDPNCLPERVGDEVRCRRPAPETGVQVGPRGGIYVVRGGRTIYFPRDCPELRNYLAQDR